MADQCKNCTIRDDIKKCLKSNCYQHENWWAQTVLEQLSEAQREIERLKKHACEYSAVDNAIINPCGFVMKLLEKFEQAEADNAALCAKLKLIEGIFIKYGKNIDYIINHSLGINKELWQAIKAVYEGNDGLF